MKSCFFALLLLLGVSACAAQEPASQLQFPRAQITIADISIVVQLANTPELRERGLMFQQSANPGMLLMYPESRQISLWMRNTTIALDVAFIDPQWRITAIKPLHPLDETPVSSPAEAIAALEMPRGWFAERNITLGQQLILTR